MPIVKLVVIGASGVGKTSLRSQYITKRFSTAYRATIGADFITKTLPHPRGEPEGVTLQIWDTAGQERFAGLSSAFFRGADAVILMYDATAPETLHALDKWWNDFKQHAPLADEDVANFCVMFVGNKIDKLPNTEGESVSEEAAQELIDSIVPVSPPQSPVHVNGFSAPQPPSTDPERSDSMSIDLTPSPNMPQIKYRSRSPSPSRSSTRFPYSSLTGSSTGLSIYHTPSSSVFDSYVSARSSPTPSSSSPDPSRSRLSSITSSASSRSSSGLTITPSFFKRSSGDPPDTPAQNTSARLPDLDPPSRRPAHYRTSAKSGAGVDAVFEYVARRVIACWEQEEARQEAATFERDSMIRLGSDNQPDGWFKRTGKACCSS